MARAVTSAADVEQPCAALVRAVKAIRLGSSGNEQPLPAPRAPAGNAGACGRSATAPCPHPAARPGSWGSSRPRSPARCPRGCRARPRSEVPIPVGGARPSPSRWHSASRCLVVQGPGYRQASRSYCARGYGRGSSRTSTEPPPASRKLRHSSPSGERKSWLPGSTAASRPVKPGKDPRGPLHVAPGHRRDPVEEVARHDEQIGARSPASRTTRSRRGEARLHEPLPHRVGVAGELHAEMEVGAEKDPHRHWR